MMEVGLSFERKTNISKNMQPSTVKYPNSSRVHPFPVDFHPLNATFLPISINNNENLFFLASISWYNWNFHESILWDPDFGSLLTTFMINWMGYWPFTTQLISPVDIPNFPTTGSRAGSLISILTNLNVFRRELIDTLERCNLNVNFRRCFRVISDKIDSRARYAKICISRIMNASQFGYCYGYCHLVNMQICYLYKTHNHYIKTGVHFIFHLIGWYCQNHTFFNSAINTEWKAFSMNSNNTIN